jgi:hypothetical protein
LFEKASGMNFSRFAKAAVVSWLACSGAATLSGFVATVGYICFYRGASSSLLYQVKGAIAVGAFGSLLIPIYLVITTVVLAPLLVLAWTPAWFLRKHLPILKYPLLAFLTGFVAGLLYWIFVRHLYHDRPPGRQEIEFASYVGAACGGGIMFLMGSFFARTESKNALLPGTSSSGGTAGSVRRGRRR